VHPIEEAGVRVRPYTADDRTDVLRLAARLTEGVAPWRDAERVAAAARGWVEESLAAAAADRSDDCAGYVAELGGAIVGMVTVRTRRHFTGELDAFIGELAVDAAAQRRGIGRALVATAETWAARRGLSTVTLETGAANASARAFYARCGYLEEDVRMTRRLAAAGR
jgi:ribosomal protein S18 acetylase RimI-like enzyme